jgi:hypothetical protein
MKNADIAFARGKALPSAKRIEAEPPKRGIKWSAMVMERIARRERAEGARSGSPYFKLKIKN